MRRSFALACFALCIVMQSVFAQPATSSLDSYAANAKAFLEPYISANSFSGTVLVAKDGKVIFEQAYGLANREWNVPNTLDTKFRIGSITKQFTATAILQLAEQGKLKIDDPISTYYADAPESWAKVTIRHLLTHTSGIPSYTDLPNFAYPMALQDQTPDELIKLTRDKPLLFEPGSEYAYSNSGYVILGYVIVKVSGHPYEVYLKQNILDPLGMQNSGYSYNAPVIANRASGYARRGNEWVNAPYISMTGPFAAGALHSTVGDLLLWDQALYANKPLTAASLQAQFTDYGHNYGLGWTIDTAFGRHRIWHGGLINGFTSIISRYPEDRLTVVVLSNYFGAPTERIQNELAGLYYYSVGGKPPEFELPEASLADYVGKYEVDGAQIVTVARQGDGLTLQGGSPPHRIFAISESEFIYRTLDVRLTFNRDERGQIAGFLLHQDGQDLPVIRVTNAELERRAAALLERRRADAPIPGGEAVLRRNIDDLRRGQPDYANMSRGLANATQRQLPLIRGRMNELGPLEGLTFRGIDPQGRDIYEAKFSNGRLRWFIALNGGKLLSSEFQPIQ